MNAIVKPKVNPEHVTGFFAGSLKLKDGREANGYLLMPPSRYRALAVIETLGPDKRLEERLVQYTAPPVYLTARELMRDLLNAEDYRSTIYDNIVRVHYEEDFAKPEKQTNV